MNEPGEQLIKLAKYNELQEFIVESKARLQTILKRLKWDTEPKLDIKDTGCDDDSEPELPASCAAFNSIVTDVEELRKIVGDTKIEVPKKFSDLQFNFTNQQKLAIYEHVVANTKKCEEPEITVPALGEEGLTFADIVAQKKRETKKRRRYRQSKPTHLENVRAMIDLQMQALQQYNNARVEEERKKNTYERPKERTDRNRSPEMKREHFRFKHRSRSRSIECEDHRRKKHRSRSVSKSRKCSKHKERNCNGSRKRDRKVHKRRSRSRSKSKKRKSHKRRSRSRSQSALRGRRRSHSMNKVNRRKSDVHEKL
ncbi:probable splicing factor, arginine/serine-rich 7 isoform X2 [Ceratitis capitata]|uniref:probable splicing factor, arginine/serine-rich 7 isoform X2 n=1 Tax=Ceratitis capitata TaxID=7213 RepID=UPI000A106C1C|nr:probable splicing factor, arginine/serine-rich 7 isoform X2 [Ceratitis capitata]